MKSNDKETQEGTKRAENACCSKTIKTKEEKIHVYAG